MDLRSNALTHQVMRKLKIISVAAIAIAGAAVSIMIQRRSQTAFRASEALRQEQSRQMAALTAEHERLSHLAAHAANAHGEDRAAELKRLHREAEALKKQTKDLDRPLAKSQQSQPSPSQASRRTPEYNEQLRQMAGRKGFDALALGYAFRAYADDHQNQSPLNLDQMAAYLAEENRTLSGTNQFEIVYQGSLDDLQGIPWGSVAVVREQQPWPGPDGRMMRVYGFADGHSQIVGSDDNFQSYEADHVIPPPATGPSGQ